MKEFSLPDNHDLHMKNLMALDFGEKFIGVATYCVNRDPFPLPYGRIEAHKGMDFVLRELKKLIDDESIDLLIVGLPHLTDGKATSTTAKAQAFVRTLRENLSAVIEEQDETLSTYEAEERMKNSARYDFKINLKEIDAVAASVILEDFIRRKKTVTGL